MVLDGEPLNRREIEELRRRMFQPSPLPAFPQVYMINQTQYMGIRFPGAQRACGCEQPIAACPSDLCPSVCLLGSDA